MNILQAEDLVKGMPDDYLHQQAKAPDGTVPQFLLISEIQRRTDMRKRFQNQQQQMPEGTVADKVMQEGIASATPQGAMPPQSPPAAPPQGMAGGGIISLAEGGSVPKKDKGAFGRWLEEGWVSDETRRKVDAKALAMWREWAKQMAKNQEASGVVHRAGGGMITIPYRGQTYRIGTDQYDTDRDAFEAFLAGQNEPIDVRKGGVGDFNISFDPTGNLMGQQQPEINLPKINPERYPPFDERVESGNIQITPAPEKEGFWSGVGSSIKSGLGSLKEWHDDLMSWSPDWMPEPLEGELTPEMREEIDDIATRGYRTATVVEAVDARFPDNPKAREYARFKSSRHLGSGMSRAISPDWEAYQDEVLPKVGNALLGQGREELGLDPLFEVKEKATDPSDPNNLPGGEKDIVKPDNQQLEEAENITNQGTAGADRRTDELGLDDEDAGGLGGIYESTVPKGGLAALLDRKKTPFPDMSDLIADAKRQAQSNMMIQIGAGIASDADDLGLSRAGAALSKGMSTARDLDAKSRLAQYTAQQQDVDRDIEILAKAEGLDVARFRSKAQIAIQSGENKTEWLRFIKSAAESIVGDTFDPDVRAYLYGKAILELAPPELLEDMDMKSLQSMMEPGYRKMIAQQADQIIKG